MHGIRAADVSLAELEELAQRPAQRARTRVARLGTRGAQVVLEDFRSPVPGKTEGWREWLATGQLQVISDPKLQSPWAMGMMQGLLV